MKSLLWLCVLPLLGSCVVYDARQSEYTQVLYRVESTTTDASQYSRSESHPAPVQTAPKVIVKTLTTPVPSRTADNGAQAGGLHCKPYILPTAWAQPLPPTLTDPGLQPEELDKLVTEYIKALREHITNERTALEDSYKAWLKECQD